MEESNLVLFTSILLAGILAQWLAWRLKLPAILPLLVAGVLIGPVFRLADPQALFGPILVPFISGSVALILFEGGLGLRLRDLSGIGAVFYRLISIGALATFAMSFAGAYFLLGLSVQVSALLSAILIVTGPTVILPILRQVRIKPDLSSLLKWEGIVIDPIGAVFAVLTYEVIQLSQVGDAPSVILSGFFKTAILGGSIGFSTAFLLIGLMRWKQIPDTLHIPVTIGMVISAFVAANMLQPESGLLASTVMGIVLANQKWVPIKHIVEFKENLGVLLLSLLFIILAARLKLEDLLAVRLESVLFLALLLLVVRPGAVLLSTLGTKLSWRERGFLAWMAPRGIVAASVAVIFQERLLHLGIPDSDQLTTLVFLVIIVSVLVYGFSALPLAQWLGLTRTRLNGVLILGAHTWARQLAKSLQQLSIPVLLVDTNLQNVAQAQQESLPAYAMDILSDELRDNEQLLGEMGHLLALTSNDEVNTLAVQGYKDFFGEHVYQLALRSGQMSRSLLGRIAFGENATHERLEQYFANGATIDSAKLDARELSTLRTAYGLLYPLFLIDQQGGLQVYTPAIASLKEYKSLIYLKTAA